MRSIKWIGFSIGVVLVVAVAALLISFDEQMLREGDNWLNGDGE